MEVTSNENSASCFTKLKSCLCSASTKAAVQSTALFCAGVASLLWIPIDPLKGAGVGASGYLILYKGYSEYSMASALGELSPRSWKQIILGAAVSTGMMALAFTIHGVWAPFIGAAGPVGGLVITYNDRAWERCCGSYGLLPPNGNHDPVEA